MHKLLLSTIRFVAVSALATSSVSTFAASAATDGSSADGSSAELQEIVVTARRRAENLQDVPVAVTVVDSTALQELHVVKATDLGQIAPGLASAPSNRGSSSPTYEIRGVRGPNTETLLLDPAVAVYFAQVNQSRTVGTNQTLYDLDSVQVLKGPQGTLFGRNSTGGAILIEPKKPVFALDGYAQASLGDYGYRDFEGAFNTPLGDKVAIRVAAKITNRDGYLHYIGTGQDVDDIDAKSVRVSLTIRPTESIDSTFIATHYQGGGAGEGFKLVAVNPLGVTTGLGPARPIYIATLQSQLAATQLLPKYQAYENTRQSLLDRSDSIQNNTTIDLGNHGILGDVSLINIAGYKNVKDEQNGAGFSGVGFSLYSFGYTNIRAQQFSEEFQLQGKVKDLNYVLGLFYFREWGTDEFTTDQFFGFADPDFQSQLLASAGPATTALLDGFFPSRAINNVDVVNQSMAAFAHGDYDLSSVLPGLSLSGGARITRDQRSVVYHNQTAGGITPTRYICTATGAVYSGIDPADCSFGGDVSFHVPTYDVGLSYKADPNLLLYLTSRRGYRSGGFGTVPPTPGSLDGASFGPEYNRDVELGLKSTFGAGAIRGRANIAIFHDWYTDIQETITRFNNNTSAAITANAAKGHIDGGEVEVALNLTDSLEIDASGSIIKPKFDSWFDNIRVNGAVVPIDLSDSGFAFLPYRQYVVSAQYTLPLPASLGRLSVRGTVLGQSQVSTANPDTNNCGPAVPAGTPPLYVACLGSGGRLPGYSIVKLRADWRNVAKKGFDLAFFVDNLTNKYYETFAFNALGSAFGASAASLGAPRMFGVELRVPFGASAY